MLAEFSEALGEGARFAIPDTAEADKTNWLTAADLPAKALGELGRAKRAAFESLIKAVDADNLSDRGRVKGLLDTVTAEYLAGGEASQEALDALFEALCEEARTAEGAPVFDGSAASEEAKGWARHDFESAMGGLDEAVKLVKRYAADREKAETPAEEATTPEQVKGIYEKMKPLKKQYERTLARTLLTEEDERQLNALLRGDKAPGDVTGPNAAGILAVYEARREYNEYAKRIARYNASRRAALAKTADELLGKLPLWRDKKIGLNYSTETMERNIRYITDGDTEAAEALIREYITPVHRNTAAATRMKNEYRERVKALGLSRKAKSKDTVSEAHAAQLLGEAEDNIRMLEQSRGRMKDRGGKTLEEWRGVVQDLRGQNAHLDWGKIEKAVAEFRKIYDELFEKMNEARVRNGYEPVSYRRGYFPHFQPGDNGGVLATFGRALGISTEVTALPTTINGLTHTFRPGIQWFGNTNERLGFSTAYDAVEGFDKYIEGVSDVVHHTDDIQRLRALSNRIRYKAGDKGIREQMDKIDADAKYTEAERQTLKDALTQSGRYKLSNFVVELEDYTNLLANKQSRHDRDMEQQMGRRAYEVMKAVEGRVAANMVAINPASWLTNFIPLVQGGAALRNIDMLAAMWETVRNVRESDGFTEASSFLTSRRGSDPLVRTWAQAASSAMSTPMEWIDNFTSEVLVRARYRQNLKLKDADGNARMTETQAVEEADSFAAGVMADRSKGAMPTVFSRRNPVTKLFTQFQIEVKNQYGYLFKDLPGDVKDKGLGALVWAFVKYMLGSWLFNEAYEAVIGRRSAFDPIGILNEASGDLFGFQLPNLFDGIGGLIQGEGISFETEPTDADDALLNLGKNIAEEIPFVGGLLGGGRLPISTALPDLSQLWGAGPWGDWAKERQWQVFRNEFLKPLSYIVAPFGAGQAWKIADTAKAAREGGVYNVTASGAKELKYPFYNDPGDWWRVLGSALFGTTSTKPGQAWIENDFPRMGTKPTSAYELLMEEGLSGREAYAAAEEWQALSRDDTLKGTALETRKRELVAGLGLDDEQALDAYIAFTGTDDEDKKLADIKTLMDAGLRWEEITGAYYQAGVINDSYEKTEDKRTAWSIWAEDQELTEDERAALNEAYGWDSGKYDEMRAAGLDGDAASQLATTLTQLVPAEGKNSVSAAQKYRAIVEADGLTVGQKYTALSAYIPDDGTREKMELCRKSGLSAGEWLDAKNAGAVDRYLAIADAGATTDQALVLAKALCALEPLEEGKSVTDQQQVEAITATDASVLNQLSAISTVVSADYYARYEESWVTWAIEPKLYAAARRSMSDADKAGDNNGSLRQSECTEGLRNTEGLTNEQRAVLWQMNNKSWKPGSNPFSTGVGRQVYDWLNK